MKTLYKLILSLTILVTASLQISHAQCTWQTVLTDGFEYATICPDLIPGTTIHNTPQSFAVHTGATSLYLNFVNCVGGVGTCPGAKVYERKFVVCRNQPVRFSAWLTTSFAGTQSNVHIKITDSNGNILNDQLSILAPYAPIWTQYQCPAVIPASDTVIFTMYTNVGGGGGNDLSMDDFLFEKCTGGNTGNSTTSGSLCDNAPASNLYPLITGINDTTGTWSGPSSLGGGYLGTFDPGINQAGAYVYQNYYFGTGAGCPPVYDTVLVSIATGPVVNLGTDTTLCTNQSVLLNAGSAPGNTYLWSNGVTGPNVLAFTTSTVNITNTYSVLVTGANGCSNADTILVSFEVCSGLSDNTEANGVSVYPNPSNGEVYVNYEIINGDLLPYSIYNTLGEVISEGFLHSGVNQIEFTGHNTGVYFIRITTEKGTQVMSLIKQ